MYKLFVILAFIAVFSISGCGEKKTEEAKLENQNLEQTQNETNDKNTTNPAPNSTESLNNTSEIGQAESEKTEAPIVEKIDKTNSPLVGEVVSINDIAGGGSGVISSTQTGNSAGKGQILAFKSDGQIYLVYNEDGTFGSKTLANFIGKKNLKIKGEIKKIDEMQILIATNIE